jgi:phosphoglycolate phosphatase-like HAD superfamily hydrolase
LDICEFTKKTRPDVLAERTTSQIKANLEELLIEIGFTRRKAQLHIENAWDDCTLSDPSSIQPVTDLKQMFQELKSRGIKIAVLTSGSCKESAQTFKRLHLEPLVDLMLCGDDPLPHPGTGKTRVEVLCQQMGVHPAECVVVGDTAGDVRMASKAGTGRIIGVLTGIGTRLDLHAHSDIIANSVQEALPYILDLSKQPTSSKPKTNPNNNSVSLVIFDKDGTLICFNSMWTPWAMSLAKRKVSSWFCFFPLQALFSDWKRQPG